MAAIANNSRCDRTDAANPANATALTVRNLSVFFGDNHVLKNVSLDIAARAVTAIIGPSGCGKSTFLRASTGCTNSCPKRG
jgi:phosphate transport system ATP-binding protein